MTLGTTLPESAVQFTRTLPAPVERVWDQLVNPALLPLWLGAPNSKCTIDARPAGLVHLMDGHIQGVVTQAKPNRQLIYTWNVFSPGQTESSYPESYVTFDLAPQDNQTLLTLTHRPIPAAMQGPTMMGWHTFLDLFENLLAGKPLQPRATLMAKNKLLYNVTNLPS